MEEIPFPDALTPAEEIAVEYADLLERMVDLNKRLIAELAQYRVMDAEERELEKLSEKMGVICRK